MTIIIIFYFNDMLNWTQIIHHNRMAKWEIDYISIITRDDIPQQLVPYLSKPYIVV